MRDKRKTVDYKWRAWVPILMSEKLELLLWRQEVFNLGTRRLKHKQKEKLCDNLKVFFSVLF